MAAVHVEVRTSGVWQLSSIVIASRGVCVVIDPGYFPRELAELRTLAASLGTTSSVVFTHGHWDHVLGWREFPGARVVGSAALSAAVATSSPVAEKNLAEARDFDGRWYVDRGAPIAWPSAIDALTDGDVLTVGDVHLEAHALPGHSADGLALVDRAHGLLLAGDYLSPLEIPFVDDLAAYRATLVRLDRLLAELERVIPGHGPALDAPTARAIAAADLDYLEALAEKVDARDVAGALAVPLPRAADVPGMIDHHRDNVRKAGLVVP
ncbi:MBL fold metallo-hydrolase [Myxococcota bacterium]|nr:MBL fold metallo-hydrolase [Myxococcota bacterium]